MVVAERGAQRVEPRLRRRAGLGESIVGEVDLAGGGEEMQTRLGIRAVVRVKVSPATARMGRLRLPALLGRSRFPRDRGDELDLAGFLDHQRRVPPRPRGWASFSLLENIPDDGSPATAGMGPADRASDT